MSWTTTGTIFVKQYDREMRRIKREAEKKDYESMAAISGVSRGDNLRTPVPPTTVDAKDQEYIAALEEKAAMQDAHIEELMARNPPVTVPATNVAAATSTITWGTSRSRKTSTQLTELQSSLSAMLNTVATQATAITALTKQVGESANRRGDSRRNDYHRGGSRRVDDNKNKPPAEKHTCPKCKLQRQMLLSGSHVKLNFRLMNNKTPQPTNDYASLTDQVEESDKSLDRICVATQAANAVARRRNTEDAEV